MPATLIKCFARFMLRQPRFDFGESRCGFGKLRLNRQSGVVLFGQEQQREIGPGGTQLGERTISQWATQRRGDGGFATRVNTINHRLAKETTAHDGCAATLA